MQLEIMTSYHVEHVQNSLLCMLFKKILNILYCILFALLINTVSHLFVIIICPTKLFLMTFIAWIYQYFRYFSFQGWLEF